MIDLENAIYEKLTAILSRWYEEDIYALSFLVETNGSNRYKDFDNVPCFAVSYNTEDDCSKAGPYEEERWNYAFWRQNEHPVIDPGSPDELTDLLFDWYTENGITNIGGESEEAYDSEGNYIGKGPVGHYELLHIVAKAARRLQQEGFITKQFGKSIPILVHGLEYAWYDIEATVHSNPGGEAATFLKAAEELGYV